MSNPFIGFIILPSYSRGFYYSWEIAGDFNDEGPWEFTIQEGLAPKGPWKTISPKIENAFAWKEENREPVNKANVLYFRVVMRTAEGKYESPAIQPYGTLNRRDFLVAREVMRQSVIHSKGMAGVECDVYLVSTFGPKCQACLDPITGAVRDSHCKHCFGTGRDPAYNGPYRAWANFSDDNQHKTNNEQHGTVEQKAFQVTLVGNPVVKQGDVLIVPATDKRYYVNQAAVSTAMRMVPILQTLVVSEAPQTDKIYDL